MTSETRNIIDHYHYWTTEAIKADLDSKRNNFSILCANIHGDFNIATVIRNSNAFLASMVYIYGRKRYDKRGTVGTHNYERFQHVKDIESFYDILRKKNVLETCIVAIDNIPGAESIECYQWSPDIHYIFCFGEEQLGLPKELIDMADKVLYIKQYGSVRSINVGTASGIVMYDYCSKVI
jgi:tRNA G18 (ribose-2'-O)-methylase SpoU